MDAEPRTTLCMLLTEAQAAESLSLSVRTLQAWREQNTGPSYVKAGRAVRYSRGDLVAWVRRNRVSPGRGAEH